MQVYPTLVSAIQDGAMSRALCLGDCAPGDLVYLVHHDKPLLQIVVTDPNSGSNALISLDSGPPYFSRHDYGAEVVRIQGAVRFRRDMSSAVLHDGHAASALGSIRTTSKGDALVFITGAGAGPGAVHMLDLADFRIRPVAGRGIEFRSWSLHLDEAPAGYPALLQFTANAP